ncbi:hypothetical protein [Capnocytophaga granulosa]|uniref:hypothetical protein n=1 Tax=Capnocytophaga granulosa TaxID=45242 RepID=UPI0028EBEA30|nr:hypothetical protein [Capnocytophaga granulosa]
MKTVFKEGMKVYDQLMFPDVEGVVTSTNFIPEKSFFDKEKGFEEDFEEDYEHPYPIEVDFKGEQALYKNDGSGFMNFPTLSTKPYEVVLEGFEQKAPAPTYEEAEEWVRKEYAKGNIFLISKDVLEALRKLVILRDYYNEGWQPDWSNSIKLKYIIKVSGEKIVIDDTYNIKRTMSFKSKEIRDKFLEEQKELLEIAKPLL